MPLVSFYTPWKHQKTRGFLMFLGSTGRDQRHGIGSRLAFSSYRKQLTWPANKLTGFYVVAILVVNGLFQIWLGQLWGDKLVWYVMKTKQSSFLFLVKGKEFRFHSDSGYSYKAIFKDDISLQPTFTCSTSTTETRQKGAKYVQS